MSVEVPSVIWNWMPGWSSWKSPITSMMSIDVAGVGQHHGDPLDGCF
jgi:hypothetical protein